MNTQEPDPAVHMNRIDENVLAVARRRFLRETGAPRHADLNLVLRDHAFERTGCYLVDGEGALTARSRGSAAECAEDAYQLLREGDAAEARRLLDDALRYLDDYDRHREAARERD